MVRTFELLFNADLQRSTEYSVRVQAMTVNGTGPPSPWINAETFVHDLDGKTTILFVIYLNDRSMLWTSGVRCANLL